MQIYKHQVRHAHLLTTDATNALIVTVPLQLTASCRAVSGVTTNAPGVVSSVSTASVMHGGGPCRRVLAAVEDLVLEGITEA